MTAHTYRSSKPTEDSALPSAALAPSGLSPEAGSQAQQPAANAGHTPGPWLVNPLSAWVEVPDRDAPICALLWPTDLRSEDETFANGRLIAAAPDLLEAAEMLATAIDMQVDLAPFERAMRAAITQAKGERDDLAERIAEEDAREEAFNNGQFGLGA